MTCFAKKEVESRVHDLLKARQGAEHGTPTPFAAVKNWRASAVARFFTDYAVDSDIVLNMTIVLPGLYRSPDAYACFKDAVHAAAFVNQANALGLEWMFIEAKAAYGRALTSLARVFLDPIDVLKNTTLAAPVVIGLYEVRSILVLQESGTHFLDIYALTGYWQQRDGLVESCGLRVPQ